MSNALVRDCTALVRERGGFRGGLGDLGAAIGQHVSMPGLLTVSILRKHAENLRTQGIQITHDDEGRDIELTPVSET
jgi:hypothetical protein